MSYLNNIVNRFANRNVILVPCTKEEIENVKSLVSGTLPECYIEFLRTMGNAIKENENKEDYYDYGSFSGDTVFYLNDLIQNNNENDLKGLLQEDNSQLTVPNNTFVFYGHQGYLYAFFKIGEGENPPVYGYVEGFEGTEFPKIADSLSDFYEQYLEGKNLFDKLY